MIIQGDCRDVLAQFPDAHFDCVVVDPPYAQTSLVWDKLASGWQAAVRRVLKPSGSMWVFGTLKAFMRDADQYDGWTFAQDIVWEKHNGAGFQKDRFRRVHEQAAHFYRSDAKWGGVYNDVPVTLDARPKVVRRKERPTHMGAIANTTYVSVDGGPRLARSVIQMRSMHGSAVHPTQKPIPLISTLVACSCPPSGLVLDPFAGSGTTCVAAKELGRRFVGIELNPVYVAIAESRLVGVAT